MSKYKQFDKSDTVGGGVLSWVSKKFARPAGFKRIRTSTGAFKSFSRSARGKATTPFGNFRTKSTENIKNRLEYMNKRISGKTQKIEHYTAKLKEAAILKNSKIAGLTKRKALLGTTNPAKLAKLERKIARTTQKLEKTTAKINARIQKAQANLNKKLIKYGPKQKKYAALMERKIYKSQKRLDKGFTKTCKNLKKTGKSSVGCLEAFEKCKATGPSLNLAAMTTCVNTKSQEMGVPSGLDEKHITDTMTQLANKHFIRRFKRGRHLREIKRITSDKAGKLQTSMNKTTKTLEYGTTLGKATDSVALGSLSTDRVKALAPIKPSAPTQVLSLSSLSHV
jgi:hypothetical protein